jgi:hypothetical protein
MSEKLLAAGSATLIAAGSLLGATPALAATAADCGTHPGASVTLINGTICEVVYDTVGDFSFDAPAGVTAFEAVLIGGGAGASKETVTSEPGVLVERFGYGGSMGHYVYQDVTGALTVTVGDGGAHEWSYTESGGETLYYIQGSDGEDTVLGNNAEDGEDWREYSSDAAYGPTALSEEWLVGANNALFPVTVGEQEFARSGDFYNNPVDCPTPTYGAGGSVCGTTYEDGASGAVIIRWKLSVPALSSTGVGASAIGIGAGALLAGGVALGAVAAVRRARAKN